MAPHNIAHVITGLETGGAEMMLLRLLAHTDRLRWRPAVVSLRHRGTVGSEIERLGIPVTWLEVRGPVPGPRAVWRLRRAIRAAAPAVIHGWMYHGNLAAVVGQFMAAGRPPIVWSIRSTVYDYRIDGRLTAGVVRLGARLSHRAARIVFNSHAGAKQHAELGYAATASLVIPNGFDTGVFAASPSARAACRARMGVGNDTVLIGRVGRYHAMKDYQGFLKAAALLLRTNPDVRFVLAGEGVTAANAELSRWISTLGVGHAVHLLGELRETADLWPALDIACSSSAYAEAFPTVLGEAMACEVPCVTTDVGDSAWIVGDTGRVVPPGDPDALAAALEGLLHAGPATRRRLGAQARARIVAEFSLARVVAAYDGLYDEVLDSWAPNDR